MVLSAKLLSVILLGACPALALRHEPLREPLRHGYASAELQCECLGSYDCSSCSLASCGIDRVVSAGSLKGGTNGLRPDLPAAYKLLDSAGRRWAIKFGDQGERGRYDESVRASQAAHALAVPTPKVLQVSLSSCPAAFAHEEVEESVREFQAQRRRFALLQEFADDDLAGMAGDPFWEQVGRIAMFDWMAGRNDLFNDLRLVGQWELLDRISINRGNLIQTESSAIEIDLAFQEGCCMDDFRTVVQALGKGDKIPWIVSNVFALMCTDPDDSSNYNDCEAYFGKYSATLKEVKPKAFDSELSQAQVALGMAKVAGLVLSNPSVSADMFSGFEAFAVLQELMKDVDPLAIADNYARRIEARRLELQSARAFCCIAYCDYRKAGSIWNLWRSRWEVCAGRVEMFTRPSERMCNSVELNPVATKFRCSKLCKGANTEMRANIVAELGPCHRV